MDPGRLAVTYANAMAAYNCVPTMRNYVVARRGHICRITNVPQCDPRAARSTAIVGAHVRPVRAEA